MIDALKPAFTLFQFKDDGRSQNLGGQGGIENLSRKQILLMIQGNLEGGSNCPSVPLVPLALQVQMNPPETSQPKKFSAKKIRICFVREF